MPALTAFSFGYFGWGTATEKLVRAVDCVERARGFKPPIFVDTRIQRSGRAPGFVGRAFQDLLGDKRHSWLKGLGNRRIQSREGPAIQIDDPAVVNELLQIVIDAATDRRRVIFFCGCQFARIKGKVNCHRTRVGTLLLAAARRQGVNLEVIEWPGGRPRRMTIAVKREVFQAVAKGNMTIPLASIRSLADVASIPVGSVATLTSGSDRVHRLVGPAIWKGDEWRLPVEVMFHDPSVSVSDYKSEAELLRRQIGVVGRRT